MTAAGYRTVGGSLQIVDVNAFAITQNLLFDYASFLLPACNSRLISWPNLQAHSVD